ncbi:MAG TPA: DNA translocase FtsK [Gemmatimonadaceae bacterium]|nr:DNA translocase FtsK [Gemmatimonadaceae bacterium]
MSSTTLKREITGIALLLLAVFLAGAFVALALAEMRMGVSVEANVGPVGEFLSKPLVTFFGWPAAILIPLVPAVHALRLFGRLESRTDRSWMIFVAGLVLLLPVVLALSIASVETGFASAGIWGEAIAAWWRSWFGAFGAWVLVALSASTLTAATLAWNPIRALVGRQPAVAQPAETSTVPEKPRRKRDKNAPELGDADRALALAPPFDEMPAIDTMAPVDDSRPDVEDGVVEPRKRRKRTKAEAAADHDAEIAAAIDATARPDLGGDELPTPDLLAPPPPHNAEASAEELNEMGYKLMAALRTFRVEGELVGRTTGPVVTQYEIEPAPGVKVRQIANLSNDLALAMRAPSIRIVAPIPGRGAVGVEVPNPTSEMVSLRELIEAREFGPAGVRAALPIALGKDLEGKPVVADLAKMPHLLIAGATGSGKSVCVNTIITSLIYRHTPKTLRFLMVDPKMVELSVYNTLPHLRHKVITDNRDAASVLKWAQLEMQERYELLAANGCRNVQEFNKRVLDKVELKLAKNAEVAFEDTTYKGDVLPYVVVIVDEMADLMMTVPGEVETPIAMLAQKARAIGIHLILATQRPSVNVITGLIKANFPSRIAFRVASQIDSRTIIDGAGAETLLGNGDMLFIPPGKSEPARLQGAFLSSEETERLMKWYQQRADEKRAARVAQGLAAFDAVESDILKEIRDKEKEALDAAGAADAEDAGDRDTLFREAAEVVVQTQQGSTSLLQRRLKVGYGRAARIIDQLELAGVLGPSDGPRGREVLVGLDELDRICGPRA